MAEHVLGIDLGTSNSVVAAVREDRPEVLRDSENRAIQPSVVSFHPTGTMLVGHEAKRRRLVDPSNTIFGAKRLIGRPFDDSEVQDYRQRVPYCVVEGDNGQVLIEAREQQLSVPEISAFVLHHMKIIAERSLRQSVKRAVITVPANFNDAQRSATLSAGEQAGLEVLRIINEPTAAALAYGFGQSMNKRVLVYDFGGGTFDVTILEISGEVYEVRATAGDTYLGGNDLDEAIVQHMVRLFLERQRYDLSQNESSMERLRSVAEQVKVQLSAQAKAVVKIQEIAYGPDGKALDLNFELTRTEFEHMVEAKIDQTFEICDEAFKLAQMRANAVDEVVLVGGSTRIPMVRESVRSYFARTPLAGVNPDEVIALGAAIQGASLVNRPVLPPTAPKPGDPRMTAMGMPAPPPGAPVPSPPAASAPPIPPGTPAPATSPPPIPPGTPAPATSSPSLIPPPPAASPPPVSVPPPPAASAAPVPPPPAASPPPVPPPPAASAPPVPPPPAASPPPLSAPLTPAAPPLSAPLTPAAPGASLEALYGKPSKELEPAPEPELELVPAISSAATTAGLSAPGGIELEEAPPTQAPAAPVPSRPLLLDVTPLSLGIATVGGYAKHIIPRNSPVPVEQTQAFSTSMDDQTEVTIRICQGESRRFEDNTVLGELQLTGIEAAPRGDTHLEVTFEIDTNGILKVQACDEHTGQAAQATIKLRGEGGGASPADIQSTDTEGEYSLPAERRR